MRPQETRVRLVRTGDGQTVAIPPEFALAGEEAVLRAEDGRLILETAGRPSLLATLARMEALDEDWPGVADAPPEPVRL